MSQSFAEALSWVPKSRGLAVTLARAFDYAKDQSHRTVMLEHLLLALAADTDASVVLQACNIDLARLNGDVTSYLAGVDEQLPPNESGDPAVSADLLRILEYASAAAQQSRRREINGAIVLAAIVGDGRSPAASMLRAQGLTFEEAIKALQWANAAARGAAQQPPHSAPDPARAAAPTPQSVQTSPDSREESSPPPERPPAPSSSHDHGGREGESQQRVKGATSQSTEELLATARRRVGSGRGGGQQVSAEASPASSPAHARAPHPQSPIHQPYHEPAHSPPSQPERARGDEVETGSGDRRGEHADTLPASPPSPEPAPPRPPTPAPLRYPPPAAPSQQRGRSDQGRQGAPAAPYSEPYPEESRPSLDWARPQPGRYHQPQPQPHQRADANRANPAPPRPHTPPRQNPPHVHPIPPAPRYRPEPPRSMQAPWSEPPPQPYPPGPGPSARPPASRHSPDAQRKGASPERAALPQSAGQLLESIPRTMTAELPETVEVRIPKAEIMALSEGLQGAGAAYRHDLIVTKAMSVRLRAPEGGFWIETVSPETQWIENNLGFLSDDYASWRWTVTPQWRGKTRLQLVVSARTVGADGLVAETALPDQVIDVKVRADYRRAAARWGGLLGAAMVGGIFATYGENVWEMGRAVLIQLGVV